MADYAGVARFMSHANVQMRFAQNPPQTLIKSLSTREKILHMNSFEEFYKRMGFREYPFSTFTTENEKGKEKELFISPSCYSPIIQNYKEGNTILLTGDRGTGKTAILLDFIRNTELPKILYCRIED